MEKPCEARYRVAASARQSRKNFSRRLAGRTDADELFTLIEKAASTLVREGAGEP